MAMQLEHEFTVPVPVEQAWAVLLDVERVVPCLPGATLDRIDGNEFTGRMKVKVGPITVTYRGDATFADIDEEEHSLTIKGAGKEARGTGTASATVRARLHPDGETTRVTVVTSFTVTGRPAQVGRGVLAEVGGRLIDRFAANLAQRLVEPEQPETAAAPETAPVPATVESIAPVIPLPGHAEPERIRDTAAEDDESHLAYVVEDPAGDHERPNGARRLSAVPTPTAASAAPVTPLADRRLAATGTTRSAEDEALDLLDVAGVPILKRLAPAAGLLAALLLVIWLVRRARRPKT
ncbi:SRPBCC family protein [Rhizohabitans arisaemae]|uniref:SRPBCC family protein n=1 Tax=Rhizohabitans arisaemae TaxID=2720610 RepID=UPI0024B1C3D1|nr:SRPBCC domain-containing protein [Rhizohabitans arisaemae]